MTVLVDHPDRRFQLWSYSVSGRRVLLRSTRGEAGGTRIDVVFQDTLAVQLPTLLPGLVVARAGSGELERIVEAIGVLPDGDREVFAVTGAGYRGGVIAALVHEVEDAGDYGEPSAIWPEGTGLGRPR